MDTETSSISTTPSGQRLLDNGDFLFEPQAIIPDNDDEKNRNADSDLFTSPPTVYALASSVPFPTVNQLSINVASQPSATERVAVPFRTILRTPAVNVVSTPGTAPSNISINELSPVVNVIPTNDRAMDTDPLQVPHSLVTVQPSNSTQTEQQSMEDEVHPYFAASNLPIQARSSRLPNGSTSRLPNGSTSSSTKTSPLPAGSSTNGWSKVDTGLASSHLSTAILTPPSNSTEVPTHHAVHDLQLDPNFIQRATENHNIQANAASTAAATAGESASIGSRTAVFGFAPLANPGDQQANMKSSEERDLSDRYCRTMPLDTPSHQSGVQQGESSVDTAGVPHVRAGISPSLNLDQVETNPVVQPKEPSVESLVNSKDWSTTGLGPRSNWPVELSVLMPMLMRSASPLAIYWGDQSLLIYNDAWRPILKQKHPFAMGAPGATVWSEIWDVLGPQMAQVREQGRGSDNKGLRLDLHREGYEEECYFDFTFSPIFLQDGSIGGILAFVQEVTQSILNQRRLMTLNQFSKQAPLIQSVNGAYSMITTILQESNNLDIPFSIVYKTQEPTKETASSLTYGSFLPQPTPSSISSPSINDHFLSTGNTAGTGLDPGQGAESKKNTRRVPQSAILCSTSFDRNLKSVDYGGVKEKVFSKTCSTRHIPDSLLITPEDYEPLDPASPVYDDPWAWPVRSVLADGIPRLVTLPKSTHKLARALLLPILENPSVLESRITTVLIVGINPFRMLDNQYLDFLALLVANIASLLHFGRSREEERKSTEALFELNKAKISFFQNISHELRTPLTLMLAPLDDVLNQTPAGAPTRSSLEMVRRNSRRLLKLVNTLLQFSRIEAGKSQAIFEETDLSKATREISANFESVAHGFNLQYNIICEDLDGLPGGIWVDRAMWSGILLNLIGNAFKHTWEGSVTIHQYPCKGKNGREGVAVDVKDTGVGIAAEHLDTLFGRFNRIENKQSRSHEGTGIGLSLVKELTEVHGGVVSVTSAVDRGTCFHLWIPSGRSHHPSSQIKLGDSKASNPLLRLPRDDVLNNKTDASMFVEEATQWISQKSLPGSTLTASGTDSTEEEKIEEDDDNMGIDYMRERQDSIEMANDEYEVSTMNLDEEEISKILMDLPDLVHEPSSDLDPLLPRRPSSLAQSPRVSKADSPKPTTLPASESLFGPIIMENSTFGGQTQRSELSEEHQPDSSVMQSKQRRSYIIVVDDNNDMRAYLREILGKDFRVRCAVDGLDAIRVISERLKQGKRIDLILSDVAMPNMNGYELLQRLRNDTTTMMTPFILLSARAGEEANVEGLDLGADDCLVKPFSARELLARVRSSIRLSDLRHELIREQRHALEMKQLIYSISVRIRSGLSLPQILDTASMELFKVIRCNAIRICRFRGTDEETGQHWVRYVAEIAKVGQPKALTPLDRLYPKGLEVPETRAVNGEQEPASDLRTVTNYVHPVYGSKSFISVPLIHNNKIWGYLLASRDAATRDWSQSEKLLFEQTGNQISLAIAHASLWELKKSQQVEMEAAHAANEAKTQILANTSHELRTPIGAIVGALSALEDTDYNLTGEQRDMVKIMQITSDVALSVINDLLDTAKLEAGAMSLSIKECPVLIETLEQSVRIFADKAGRKEVDLIMEPSEDLERLETLLQQGMSIWTDGDRLQQVIMNLIGNAVKFTANGKVMINCTVAKNGSTNLPGEGSADGTQQSAQTPHPRVHYPEPFPPDAIVTPTTFHFEVTDTGIGIDPDFLKNNIFKSFAQVDQSMTRRFGGTGLGLAISKHLVMMNGGILGVTSNIGQGSTFYFTWPVALVSVSTKPRPLRSMAVHPIISPELALESRAIVVEPVTESRQQLSWILNQQGVQATLYESFDTVVQDEQARSPHLLGADGAVLTANHRPNAHFFLCTRTNTIDAVVETARALGEVFKERNAKAKMQDDQHYKDHILSIVLVIYSSPQGRSLARDITKRIRANGLEDTLHCRYVVKPVKPERVVECLQMTEPTTSSHRPSGNASSRQHNQQQQQRQEAAVEARRQEAQSTSENTTLTGANQVIPADGNLSLVSSDYDTDNYYNKNTPESSSLDPDGESNTLASNNVNNNNSSRSRFHMNGVLRPSTDTGSGGDRLNEFSKPVIVPPRRIRLPRTNSGQKSPAGASADDTKLPPRSNPAFSSRAARAAAGKRERKGKCVLCVEDNIINLRVVQYQLQKLGYDTLSACNGQVAVDIINSQVVMLGESTASMRLDGEETGSGAIDGDVSMDTADESDQQRHRLIKGGLLVIPESNGNMSHIFDQTEPSSPSNLPGVSTFSATSTTTASPLSSTSSTHFEGHTPLASTLAAALGASTTVNQYPSSSTSSDSNRPPKIDLILMDCAMPVKSGFEAASEIRTMGQSSSFAAQIPIIALTASAVPSTKEKCLAAGMNGYLNMTTSSTRGGSGGSNRGRGNRGGHGGDRGGRGGNRGGFGHGSREGFGRGAGESSQGGENGRGGAGRGRGGLTVEDKAAVASSRPKTFQISSEGTDDIIVANSDGVQIHLASLILKKQDLEGWWSQRQIRFFVNSCLLNLSNHHGADTSGVLRDLASDTGLKRLKEIFLRPMSVDAGDDRSQLSFQYVVLPLIGVLTRQKVCQTTMTSESGIIYSTVYFHRRQFLENGVLPCMEDLLNRGSLSDLSRTARDVLRDPGVCRVSSLQRALIAIVRLVYQLVKRKRDAQIEMADMVQELRGLVLRCTTMPSSAAEAAFENTNLTREMARLQQIVNDAQDTIIHPVSVNGGGGGGATVGKRGTNLVQLHHFYDPPGDLSEDGPRHDNDRIDIADISVLPTQKEIVAKRNPFIPSNDVPKAPHFLPPGWRQQIDIHFRLYREDMMDSLRKGVSSFISLLERTDKNSDTTLLKQKELRKHLDDNVSLNVYGNVQFEGMNNTKQLAGSILMTFSQPPQILDEPTKRRKEFWERSRRRLMQGALVCIASRAPSITGTYKDGGQNFRMILGVVTQRDVDALAQDSKRAQIHISLSDPQSYLLMLDSINVSEEQWFLVETTGSFFESYRPILKALQTCVPATMPFGKYLAPTAEELSRLITDKGCIDPPLYTRAPRFQFDLSVLLKGKVPCFLDVADTQSANRTTEMLRTYSTLDNTQASALVETLSREIALIKGPPGTGKTKIGVDIMRVLLHNKTAMNCGPILCICYTNHALDQFLEHLLDQGVTSIVRVGARSKSERLEDYNLGSLMNTKDKPYDVHRSIRQANEDWDVVSKKIGELEMALKSDNLDWEYVQAYLTLHNVEHFVQLMRDPDEEEIMQERMDGFTRVRRNSEQSPYMRWATATDLKEKEKSNGRQEQEEVNMTKNKEKNRNKFEFPQKGHVVEEVKLPRQYIPRTNRSLQVLQNGNVWGMSETERRRLIASWKSEVMELMMDKMGKLLRQMDEITTRKNNAFDEIRRGILSKAAVIGMTTNGAAKHQTLVSAVAPKIIICEEAGEVLEAHILAALSASTQHLILIGDHLQLRPQIETYHLSSDSLIGKNYNLDRSLFERLVASKSNPLPMSHLTIQRRMRPEISSLIRNTLYPELEDGKKVRDYPDVGGMGSNLYFMNHAHAEDAKDQYGMQSFSNTFEVKMVEALAHYLIKNGYDQPGDIAVLTPYLGQLSKLRDHLKKSFMLVIDDRDLEQLEENEAEVGIDSETAAAVPAIGVKNVSLQSHLTLRTIDNYQGEEAKVVIISLVRSDVKTKDASSSGSIGFLKSPNRTNVLLSRAQHGMYLIGKASLMNQSKHGIWPRVMDELEANDRIGDGFPIVCKNHPDTLRYVDTPEKFKIAAPNGGCTIACGQNMPCGHVIRMMKVIYLSSVSSHAPVSNLCAGMPVPNSAATNAVFAWRLSRRWLCRVDTFWRSLDAGKSKILLGLLAPSR
ncbi:hypothetical protein EC991_001852 [Linnemannia zychae]|nr:hypothetical protein EC991_001852 [Linnemannia zychae]